MSYAICRVQKIKGASGITGLQIHNERERQRSNTNPDIDFNRSKDNYSLIDTHGKGYNVLADERIQQAYTGSKAIRKDAVKVCEILFTSDNEFFKQFHSISEQRIFFSECLSWAEKRFRKDNIISAIVHMDEATPHMHVDFVPLTSDGRLSAKEVLGSRFDLQRMQDDFFHEIGEPWGLERGERADLEDPTAKKPKTHKTTTEYKRGEDYKRKTADELLIEAKRIRLEASDLMWNTKKEVDKLVNIGNMELANEAIAFHQHIEELKEELIRTKKEKSKIEEEIKKLKGLRTSLEVSNKCFNEERKLDYIIISKTVFDKIRQDITEMKDICCPIKVFYNNSSNTEMKIIFDVKLREKVDGLIEKANKLEQKNENIPQTPYRGFSR